MKFTIPFLAIALIAFSSCKKEYAPYVTFKNSDYKKIKHESIDVSLNSHYYLIVENGSKASEPVFALQKNNEAEQDITNTTLVSREKLGWNGKKQLKFTVDRIHLDFNSTNFNIGDQLILSSRHSNVSESLVFKIK